MGCGEHHRGLGNFPNLRGPFCVQPSREMGVELRSCWTSRLVHLGHFPLSDLQGAFQRCLQYSPGRLHAKGFLTSQGEKDEQSC